MNKDYKNLIDGLNDDLAHEYAAAIQYTYSAAVVTGVHRAALKPFFEDEINDEMGHALYLSEKISALGGTPTTKAAELSQPTEVKDLLEATLQSETDTIKRYEERKQLAEKLGETALVVKLEDVIADETKHKEEVENLLADPEGVLNK
ncbi:ferritin-like domain-containing protein [Barrientosiimonas marina]|uniref:Ferritin-like domain-containing protein n=1 Tax=Lentibacillus kimchii TaxID=1542911 RepID=A0ABW2UR91_9BACI